MTTTRLPRARAAATRARQGFTIIEVMVAVMILSVGVLAMASTAAVTGRQMNEGSTRNRAASVAQSRFEILAARGTATGSCDLLSAVGGRVAFDSTRRGIRERWTITRPSNDGTVVVYDTLTLPRVTAKMAFESVIRCN
jgi:type IV pilus assembly protein PilV